MLNSIQYLILCGVNGVLNTLVIVFNKIF